MKKYFRVLLTLIISISFLTSCTEAVNNDNNKKDDKKEKTSVSETDNEKNYEATDNITSSEDTTATEISEEIEKKKLLQYDSLQRKIISAIL